MHSPATPKAEFSELAKIPVNGVELEGALVVPPAARGVVLFAHGSGSSSHSPRNNFVAETLRAAGIGTLLMDLLTKQEDAIYQTRFDIDLLSWRLERATQWLMEEPRVQSLDIGYFGASTGAAAALNAAATFGSLIGAVVSRGGRPDLAMAALGSVQAPTLLIVGALDDVVIELNRKAYERLKAEKQLAIVPGATHLFEEPGTLQEVARLAAAWFQRHLGAQRAARGTGERKVSA
ncbi:MAG: dienelactone hydrolase family protein [Deltaproteobacteria bacterium]|nr:dienelactone hydrolase family protein [Deltaproteobacteria bacterium]MDZ4345543.1 dienelactone hydrolase family protein [Candidatus Binatia bacterium]